MTFCTIQMITAKWICKFNQQKYKIEKATIFNKLVCVWQVFTKIVKLWANCQITKKRRKINDLLKLFCFAKLINKNKIASAIFHSLIRGFFIQSCSAHCGWIGQKSWTEVLKEKEPTMGLVLWDLSWNCDPWNPKPSFQCASPIYMRKAVFWQFSPQKMAIQCSLEPYFHNLLA